MTTADPGAGADDPLIGSLTSAVDAAPNDVALRLHLAELLIDRGRADIAVTHCAVALQQDPASARSRELMQRALGVPASAARPPAAAPGPANHPAVEGASPAAADPSFDWTQAESEVGDVVAPMFVDEEGAPPPDVGAWDLERSTVRLDDVGGMRAVKDRLHAAFLAPMRNPELRRLYGKSLRGGLLLPGPPGCGKTFIARAVAGELGAKFIVVGLADILDMWIGTSERNIHELFQFARREAPVVLFLDEVDALGQKRSATRNSAMRSTVNQTPHRARRGRGRQRRGLRPRGDEPAVGRRPGVAASGPPRPHPARPAPRPGGARSDPALPPQRTSHRGHRCRRPRQAHRGLLRG